MNIKQLQSFRGKKNEGAHVPRGAHGKKMIVSIISLILVISLVFALYLLYRNESKAKLSRKNCPDLTQKARSAIDYKNYSKVYEELKQSNSACSAVLENAISQNDHDLNSISLEYSANLAKVAYLSDDKVAAKAYAQQALDNNKKLTPEERKKVNNQAEIFYSMLDIQDGLYSGEAEVRHE